jgi:hypothetical protein
MEKEFHSMRPRIVDLRDEERDTARWLVEGRLQDMDQMGI